MKFYISNLQQLVCKTKIRDVQELGVGLRYALWSNGI